MSNVGISNADFTNFLGDSVSLSAVDLRIYADKTFVPAGDVVPVEAGSPDSGSFFRKVPCTISGGILSIPSITLPATDNGVPSDARYSAAFYQVNLPAKIQKITIFPGFDSFVLPAAIPSTSWGQIFSYNNAGVSAPGATLIVHPGDSSGTNVPGASLDLYGGKGTGNALPGDVALRYPLIGASGAAVESLSTGRFPISANMFTGALKTIANDATEKTLFGAPSLGSTLTIEGGMARVGRIFRVTIPVFLTTTGTPTARLKIKLGAVVIADSGAQTFATAGMQSRGYIVADLIITAIGSSGGAQCEPLAFWFSAAGAAAGDNPLRMISAGGSQTVDFTPAQAIDVTWQWGTASASNIVTAIGQSVDIIR